MLSIRERHRIEPETDDSWESKRAFILGVMVIVVGNGHGDTSSNPGRD